MKDYLRSFGDDTRAWLAELAGERNFVGLVVIVVFLPVIFVCDVIVHLVDHGPAPPEL